MILSYVVKQFKYYLQKYEHWQKCGRRNSIDHASGSRSGSWAIRSPSVSLCPRIMQVMYNNRPTRRELYANYRPEPTAHVSHLASSIIQLSYITGRLWYGYVGIVLRFKYIVVFKTKQYIALTFIICVFSFEVNAIK